MAIRDGQDAKGRFTPGHKLAKGRPWGARNKPLGPPQSITLRRFHGLLLGIVNDLGGRDALSTGEIQLARRAAWISMHCELMERKETTELPELAIYGTLTSHLARTLNLLGLKRVPRDVTPTLRDYLEARRIEPAEGDAPVSAQ
jgi:hypothetical protein